MYIAWDRPALTLSQYHLVYLDNSNVLRDVQQFNLSGKWIPGSLGSYNFIASDSEQVALAMCYSDDWRHGVTDDFLMNEFGGVKIFYGGQDNRVHEIRQDYKSTTGMPFSCLERC